VDFVSSNDCCLLLDECLLLDKCLLLDERMLLDECLLLLDECCLNSREDVNGSVVGCSGPSSAH
jgi:hypothetical protein